MTPRRRSGRSATQAQSYSSNEEENHEAQEEEEDLLSDLTRPQLLQINRSFDSVASKINNRASLDTSTDPFPIILEDSNSRSNRGSGNEEIAPGGFISEDQAEGEDQYEGGGGGFVTIDEDEEGGGFIADEEAGQPGSFLTEDHEESVEKGTSIHQPVSRDAIPVESIPEALKLLGSPCKDSDTLEVFEQAASSDEDESGSRRRWVQRRQFTRVCAALMADPGSVAGDQDGSDGHASESDTSFVAPTTRTKRRRKGKSKSTYSKSDHNSTDDESFIPPSEFEANETGKARSKTTDRKSRSKKVEDDDSSNVLEIFQLFFPEPDRK